MSLVGIAFQRAGEESYDLSKLQPFPKPVVRNPVLQLRQFDKAIRDRGTPLK